MEDRISFKKWQVILILVGMIVFAVFGNTLVSKIFKEPIPTPTPTAAPTATVAPTRTPKKDKLKEFDQKLKELDENEVFEKIEGFIKEIQ